MRIFLAGGESRHWIHDSLLESQKKNEMQLYLAGIQGKRKGFVINATLPRRSMALAEWGGMTKVLRNIARTFWNHSFMPTRTRSD